MEALHGKQLEAALAMQAEKQQALIIFHLINSLIGGWRLQAEKQQAAARNALSRWRNQEMASAMLKWSAQAAFIESDELNH